MIMRPMTQPRIARAALRTTTMRVLIILTTALLLSACSHKPLKAPCDPNEGKPTAVTGFVLSSLLPESLVALMANDGPCGPLRRIGQD